MPVLCLGEVLIDRFDHGCVPGGAPANVACHVAALGEPVALLSRVGSDADGEYLTAWLHRSRVDTDLMQTDDAHPTGAVRVQPGPRYEMAGSSAWDFIGCGETAREASGSASVLVFGTLAQRQPVSRRTIRALVDIARRAAVPVLCDLNLRAPFYDAETILWSLRHCDVLKLNRGELGVVSRMLQARGETEDLFAGLLSEFTIARGVLTDGEKGAWISEDGCVRHQPAERTETAGDAVGAGDAFCAVLAVALARGLPVAKAAAPAAALAAFVVSHRGATPEIPAALTQRLNGLLAA